MRKMSLLLPVVLLTALALPAWGGPKSPALFREAPGKAKAPDDDPAVVRSRLVTVAFKSLAASRKSAKVRFEMNLFPDVSYFVVLERTANPGQTYNSWYGSLEGVEGSQVVLIEGGGMLMGSVRTPTESYRIRYVGEVGVHAIEEVDTSRYPQEAEGIPIEGDVIRGPAGDLLRGQNGGASSLLKLLDDGSTFDVLVVYTPAARAAAGGTTAIQNLIALGITETNQAYANSNVVPRLRLVHTEEISYTESGDIQTDLTRLRGQTEGFMDGVHSLRNTRPTW
jgi:hypothetical protein